MVTILDLPHELILWITDLIVCLRDLKSWVCVSRAMQNITEPLLYKRGVQSSALLWAVDENCASTIRKVLRYQGHNGCAINARCKDGRTPLWLACSEGKQAIVTELLCFRTIDVNLPDRLGRTPLFIAARNGHEPVVRILLGRAAVDVNAPLASRQSLLSRAVELGYDAMVGFILKRNSGLDRTDSTGQTPLHAAVLWGHTRIAELLLDKKSADVMRRDSLGQTPLALATFRGNVTLVKRLLGGGQVEPDSQDVRGTTPLMLAVEQGHESIVQLYLDREDVSINHRDRLGRTPLETAMYMGRGSMTQIISNSIKATTPPLVSDSTGHAGDHQVFRDHGRTENQAAVRNPD